LGGGGRSVFCTVFHAEGPAFDDDGVAVVEEEVEDGGVDGGGVVEDGGPLFEGFVGGEEDGASFVTGADKNRRHPSKWEAVRRFNLSFAVLEGELGV